MLELAPALSFLLSVCAECHKQATEEKCTYKSLCDLQVTAIQRNVHRGSYTAVQ